MEEETYELKKESNNSIFHSEINLNCMSIDLLSTEQTPSQNGIESKNITNRQINEEVQKFVFKPYLTARDECKFDEDLIIENRIKELHKLKSNYLNYQPDLSVKKRFILFDWLMEVTFQLHLTKKIYYSSINLIELFFSKSTVDINKIQLIGIVCLLLSAKNEGIEITNLSYFTNLYSKSEILNYEVVVLKTLKWKIQYINLCDLANILISKWDSIIIDVNNNFNEGDRFPVFLKDPKYNNLLFNHYFQILDYISLDYFYNFLHEKYICVSVMFIIIGVAKKVFTYEDAFQFFNNINPQNTEIYRGYQRFFFNFVKQYFKINMVEILDVLKYVCLFSVIKFDSDITQIYDSIQYKDIIQFQMYNKNNSYNIQKLKEIREINNLNY
jgi:hypothetical protein